MTEHQTRGRRLTAVIAVVVAAACACGPSKPLPTIDNVTDGMLMAYPGVTVLRDGGGAAVDDTYLDSGGDHRPFTLWKEYQLAESTKRDKIFDWACRKADKIGLKNCETEDNEDYVLRFEKLTCDAEEITGYPGGVALGFSDSEGSRQERWDEGFVAKYRVSIALCAA